jgi:hypothetical protein
MRGSVAALAAALAVLALAGCSDEKDAPEPEPVRWRGVVLVSLPGETVQQLQDGEEGPYAEAARRNGYPSAEELLRRADDLGLDDQQRADLADLHLRTTTAASNLGTQMLDAYLALEQEFQKAEPDMGVVQRRSDDVGLYHGRLTSLHLAAHAIAGSMLTPAQLAAYQDLAR